MSIVGSRLSVDMLLDKMAARIRTKGEVQQRRRDKKTLCKPCRQLYLKFLLSLVKEQKIERLLQHIGVSDCPLCSLMLPRIPQEPLLPQRQGSQAFGRSVVVRANKGSLYISLDGMARGVIRKASVSDLENLQRDGGCSINCSLIKSWLRHCQHKHGDECNVSGFALARYRYPIELTLVDTKKRRIIEGESDWTYIALSYVWGGVKMPTMTTESFDSLRKDGSLSPDRHDIPSVLKDAMELVSRIGERYLWIDALCIQQDSPEKHKDLARMDVIYSHALFTIVAVDGTNANASLPGLWPRSRLPLKPVVHTASHVLISEPPSLDEVLKSSKYETRGWTLQERVLSRRCLYISEQGMYFQCNTSTWSETTGLKGRTRERSYLTKFNTIRLHGHVLAQTLGVGPSTRATLCLWSQALLVYYELVELYSSRSLSYPDDVVNAFAGFSSVFAESCGGSFVAGLPTAALASSLLWMQVLDSMTSRTRVALLSTGIVRDFSLDKAHNVVVRARSTEPSSEDLPPVDLLQFHAWIVDTHTFNISPEHGISRSSSVYPTLSLFSRGSKKRCGVLFGVLDGDSARICLGDWQFKLAAISRQETSRKQRNEYPVLKEFGISAVMNVMLIKRSENGRYFERAGIGLIRYNAYEKEVVSKFLLKEDPLISHVPFRSLYVSKTIEQELRNLERLRGTIDIVQLTAPVVSRNPYRIKVGNVAVVLQGFLVEHHPNGTLDGALKANTRDFPWDQWAYQITHSLKHLHDIGITHVDHKPENIVNSADQTLVIIDWLSPEMQQVLEPLSENFGERRKNDIWALGKILFAMADATNNKKHEQMLRNLLMQATAEVHSRISLQDMMAQVAQ
ncbi:heterokaryon incompatibility protein-domain-containing protein [Leptodontidium sp. MPI-SDFR-AT-0119]|nr:heterokaryon incompatibility protein-domain-containing protein [Leptodontidium sp. MPI-SDFR-AT-0119]